MSAIRTGMLLAAMTALFALVGFMLGGTTGMVIAFGLAAATNAFAYWNSDKLALRMHGAQPVTRASQPELYVMVEDLARSADMPVPKVYIINQQQPNAFATGRNPENGAVAVTLGLLGLMSRDELEGVIAHELAHIKNRDTLTMTIAATVAGAISMLAQFGFLMGGNRQRGQFGFIGILLAVIFAPMAAGLIQMTISRTREYAADRDGADISGNPLALASALQRIHTAAARIDMPSAEASPHSGHMFIINPLHGLRLDRMFATHPPVESRIQALRDMASDGTYTAPQRRARTTRRSPIPTVRRR